MGDFRPFSNLPPNWNYGVTSDGRVFFIDEQRRWTTWIHPVTQQPYKSGFFHDQELPDGWEVDCDDNGRVYFINDKINANNENNENKSAFQRTASKKKFGFLKTGEKAPIVERDFNANVALKGWLYKQDDSLLKIVKQWKKRWFVLADGNLFCYEGDTELQLVLAFNVRGCRITTKVKDDNSSSHKFVFKVEQGGERKSVHLAGETEYDMEKWVSALTEVTQEAVKEPTNLQRYPNQSLAPSTNSRQNFEDPSGQQVEVGYNYNGPYISADEFGGVDAPTKPPRLAEPAVDYSRLGQARLQPDVLAADQRRLSAYPYRTREDQQFPADARSLSRSSHVVRPGAYDYDTPTGNPASSESQQRAGAIVVDSPQDLYAKVVKKNRPGEGALTPSQAKNGDTDVVPSGRGDGAHQPSEYDGRGQSYGVNPWQDSMAQQQPRYQREVPSNRVDLEFNGRDNNFNISKSDASGRDAVPRPMQQRPPYSGGERHLDGTPMFGDSRREMPSPSVTTIRGSYRDLNPVSQIGQVASSRAGDGDIFKYPPTNSTSQLGLSGAYDPQKPGSVRVPANQRGEEYFLAPREPLGSQPIGVDDVHSFRSARSDTYKNGDDLPLMMRRRSSSRMSTAGSASQSQVPSIASQSHLKNNMDAEDDSVNLFLDFNNSNSIKFESNAFEDRGYIADERSVSGSVQIPSWWEVDRTSLHHNDLSPYPFANGIAIHSPAFPDGSNNKSGYRPELEQQASQTNRTGIQQQVYQPTMMVPSRGIDAIKEDPDMSDAELLTSKTLEQLKKHLSGHVKLRLSISTGDLVGKSHEELVLLLIQLRRSQTQLEELRQWLQDKLRSVQRPSSRARLTREANASESDDVQTRYIDELQNQLYELDKQIEITQPLVNLLHNMVTMGSLYGANNLLYASQYKKGQLAPDQRLPADQMIEFSRQHQEEQLASRQKQSERQLTEDEATLEERVQRLYQLDKLVQERIFNVSSLQEDKAFLERNLEEVSRLESFERDITARSRLSQRRQVVEQEQSRVHQKLAEASKQLEEATAENSRVEKEVVMLRNKIYDLSRGSNSPAVLAQGNGMRPTVLRMEQELEQVKTMMQGLSTQASALSETIQSLKPDSTSSQNTAQPTQMGSGTYFETDFDRMATRDIAVRTQPSRSRTPNVGTSHSTRQPSTGAAERSRSERRPELQQNVRAQPLSAVQQSSRNNATMSGGHFPPYKRITSKPSQQPSRSRPSEPIQSSNPTASTHAQRPHLRSSKPTVGAYPDITRNVNVQTEMRRAKSVPRVDRIDQQPEQYVTSRSRDDSFKAEPSKAVQRLFPLYVPTSDNFPPGKPTYTSAAKYQPSGLNDDHRTPSDRLSDNSQDLGPRDGFQRWRNMTISSSNPAAFEKRNVHVLRSGNGGAPKKSHSTDDLVRGDESKALEFDNETIDRELERPAPVLIPERYDPEDINDEPLTEEEQLRRMEKTEKFKKMLAAHSLQEFSESELADHDGSIHVQLDNEMKRREELLDMKQRLAQEVTEKSKVAAIRRKSNPNIPDMFADRGPRIGDQSTPDIIGYIPMP